MFDKEALVQAYNQFAAKRDQTVIAPWKAKEREQFAARLHKDNLGSLLEIGAGTGKDSLFMQQQGLEVTCIDLSGEMVKFCREKGLNAHVMDVSHLQFKDQSFDAVYAMNSLLHIPKADLGHVLREIHRVLRTGGLFFCGVYGGQDTEGVWEKDSYEPKRFFAMYQDADIVRVFESVFTLQDFHTVPIGEGQPHFQSMLLRKGGQ